MFVYESVVELLLFVRKIISVIKALRRSLENGTQSLLSSVASIPAIL